MGKAWLLHAALLVACLTARGEDPINGKSFELALPADPNGGNSLLEKALDQQQFDRVEFKNVTWIFVHDFFEAKYSSGTTGWGRPVFLELHAPTSKPISLSLSNVSCRTVIAAACQQTGGSYAVDNERVIILPDASAKKRFLIETNFRWRLKTIIIGKFNFERLGPDDIDGIAHFLTNVSKRDDPEHRGIIVLSNLPFHPMEERVSPVKERVTPIHREPFSIEDAPLCDVLNYVSQATGLPYAIDSEKNTVIFTAPNPKK